MKILLTCFRSGVVLGLALLLSGCLISAQGDRHGRVVITDGNPPHRPTAHKPGPPPHAKAHGHRAKYNYRYYPDSGIYFDTGRSVYFYLDSGGAWRMTVSLPRSLNIRLGDHVSIEMEADRPYGKYHEHKKKYPAGKKKKKHKKKYSYHYYPNSSIYYDTGRSVYFYLDSAGAWRMTVSLPRSLKIHLGDHVSVEMEADRPYIKNHEHKKKYPAGKKNKKHKWK